MSHTTDRDWIDEYQKARALWIYDGDPKKPHAILTSGLHSTGFFYSTKVTEVPYLLAEAAIELVRRLEAAGCDLMSFDVIAGPETGATKLAQVLAAEVGFRRKRICHFVSPKKDVLEGGVKIMTLSDKDKETVWDRRVLMADDALTTGGSVQLCVECITDAGGTVVSDFILALANRSGEDSLEGRRIIELIRKQFPVWKKDECPHCQAGSEAIPPKGDNWTRFMPPPK